MSVPEQVEKMNMTPQLNLARLPQPEALVQESTKDAKYLVGETQGIPKEPRPQGRNLRVIGWSEGPERIHACLWPR